MAKQSSVRLAAAQVIARVAAGASLNQSLPAQQALLAGRDQALLAELSYGTLRYYFRLDAWLNHLMERPLKAKEKELHSLILVGLYQLFYTRIPPHAAIGETVQATRSLGKAWARGLVNGLLRNAQRQADTLTQLASTSPVCATAHPTWLVEKLKKAWPEYWQIITEANNQPPPMTLRVNSRLISRDRYLKKLLDHCLPAVASSHAPEGLVLNKPAAVGLLPLFKEGGVSVQDESAQLAAHLLPPLTGGQRILDACCAPGGKACHLLERYPQIQLHALDSDEHRLVRMRENLERLSLVATVLHGDASQPQQWWDGQPYDHILLDAPCSATGVIRRHPDIKLLRTAADIAALAKLQQAILDQLWPLLKPGGSLLYVTCSVMPEENHKQIEAFLATHQDARLRKLSGLWGHDTGFGQQIFPASGDGFFYSLLEKTAD